jgi:hypothetical protein
MGAMASRNKSDEKHKGGAERVPACRKTLALTKALASTTS